MLNVQTQLKQLERLRSEDTPRRPMITHNIDQFILDPKSKQDKVTNLRHLPQLQMFYTRHNFWSCLIRYVNIKWIWGVL